MMIGRKLRYMVMIFINSIIFTVGGHIAYGQDSILSEIKATTPTYKVEFKNEKAMVTRDGSEAIPIKSGTILNKPGVYYVSLFDKQGISQIKKITLPSSQNKTSWTITKEEELEEILKDTLENFKKTIEIDFNCGSYTFDEVSDVLTKYTDRVLMKYPKLVYEGSLIRCQVYSNKTLRVESPKVELTIEYPLKVTNSLKQYDAKASGLIDQVIHQKIAPSMADYEAEWTLFQYIIDSVTYSKTVVQGVDYVNPTPMSHTLYGALIDKKAVCDGYASSLMYLLNTVGVPTRMIVGDIKGGEAHGWNMVKIQGAYYHVDSTWADEEGEGIGAFYNYFNEQDSYMRQTHVWDANKHPKAVTQSYSGVYMPLDIRGIYKVNSKNELSQVLMDMKRKQLKKVSVIFKDELKNKWHKDELLRQIVSESGGSITYYDISKYNCLVISFNRDLK